ncbi:MAG TPA: Lpp/OprI family alanine-zipper lipoprotein [Alphaproteobacteria bacterium]|jgi:hypothetical protein
MKVLKTMLVAALPLAMTAGCTTLAPDDKSMVEKASADARAAQDAANRAAASAQQAADAANRAAAAAENASREAKMAGDKADRVFQRNLRKR